MRNQIIQASVYVAFFGLIASAMFITKSAMPLWALLLVPGKLKDMAKETSEKL
jgi:hypothetical protein